MKNGKYIPLGEYKNVKIGYGTVDFKNLKTIYLKLNSWVQPKTITDDFDAIIYTSRKNIKKFIMELNDERFHKESIVDLDIRTKGIKAQKRSFMNLEITLFIDNNFDLKSHQTKNSLKELFKKIITFGLDNKILFNFNKTKK